MKAFYLIFASILPILAQNIPDSTELATTTTKEILVGSPGVNKTSRLIDSDNEVKDSKNDIKNWIAPPEMVKNYPYYLSGYDYENRPVWIVEAGRFNFRKIVEAGPESIANFEKYARKGFYNFQESIKKQQSVDEGVTGMIFIVDLDNFSLQQLVHVQTVSLLLKIVSEQVNWLSKNLHLMLILNTNSFAHTLVNLGRPILGRIMENVEVYGTQRSKWQPLVLRHVPKNQLPEFYGGIKNFTPIKIYG